MSIPNRHKILSILTEADSRDPLGDLIRADLNTRSHIPHIHVHIMHRPDRHGQHKLRIKQKTNTLDRELMPAELVHLTLFAHVPYAQLRLVSTFASGQQASVARVRYRSKLLPGLANDELLTLRTRVVDHYSAAGQVGDHAVAGLWQADIGENREAEDFLEADALV